MPPEVALAPRADARTPATGAELRSSDLDVRLKQLNLVPLSESGEIQAGTLSESQEIVLLQTFARRIRVTRLWCSHDCGAMVDARSVRRRRANDDRRQEP